jgi:hypothetical protein
MAAKIIENVCTTFSAQAQGFTTGEIGPVLWHLFRHSTVDALRITAISVSPASPEDGTRDSSTLTEEIPLNSKFNGKSRDVGQRDISRGVLEQNSKNWPGRVWDFVGCGVYHRLKVDGAEYESSWQTVGSGGCALE